MADTRQHVVDFFDRQGLSLADLDAALPEIAPWETLILGGSIPEGLANAYSDIDLLRLGHPERHDRSGLPPIQADAAAIAFKRNMGELRVQVETVPIAHLERLARRMAAAVKELDHPETAPRVHAFNELDLRTIHRIRTGLPLRNEAVADVWMEHLHCNDLPRHTIAFLVAQYSNAREDVLGELKARHLESALWLLRHAVSAAAGALLAGFGETTPSAKWRVRLLQRHEAAIGPELARSLIAHLSGQDAGAPEACIDAGLAACDRAVRRALDAHPSLGARRSTMLARAVAQGVVLPGSRPLAP
jgi:hypothetical protein